MINKGNQPSKAIYFKDKKETQVADTYTPIKDSTVLSRPGRFTFKEKKSMMSRLY